MSRDGADLAALDQLMTAEKTIVGSRYPGSWTQGRLGEEQMIAFPVEINGEQSGVRLELAALPNAPEMHFRLCLIASTCLCQLDYTDETHANSFRQEADGVPIIVTGHHYHSWRGNRRFFRGSQLPLSLHNAEPYSGPTSSFDNILRWFCSEINALSQRWPAKFGQVDKWNFCLRAARVPRIRSDNDETSSPDP
jgi:hypothetical protein